LIKRCITAAFVARRLLALFISIPTRWQEKKILPLMVMNQSRLGLGRVSKKPVELTDRRAYTELFTYHDEFLQNLYTGHRMLYDSDEK
jgi:hypothetical protein